MKYFFKIIYTILILLSCNAIAQNHLHGMVKYDNYFPKKTKKTKKGMSILYFNNESSLEISSVKKKINSNSNVKTGSEIASFKLPYGDSKGRQIYRNIKDSLMITRRPKNAISEPFIVQENWIVINWSIKNETKKIGSYIATKAEGDFRGRAYTVWFTYSIPVSFGPWKLHGLPGLILEAEDSEKMIRFFATKIKIPFQTGNIIKTPIAKNKITHVEEVFMKDNFDKILAKKMNARLPKGTKITPRPNNDGRTYRSEKTFEWENKANN